jgi:hypothetical protein
METCYDLLFDSGGNKAAIRDASGVTVATVSTETGEAIVTCPGAPARHPERRVRVPRRRPDGPRLERLQDHQQRVHALI